MTPELPRRAPLRLWRALLTATMLAISSVSLSAGADFINASQFTRCAEEDNVYVKVQAAGIHRFSIVAEHPHYVRAITTDSTAPDFTHCDMSGDPRFRFTPLTTVLYEDHSISLVGHRFDTFWRGEQVDFWVGDRNVPGLHLVQLLRKGERDIEILVVYPADGYWRAKPLPPAQLPDSAYGSSFLIGPIEEDGRPLVRFRSLRFNPQGLRFDLQFADASRGRLSVVSDTREKTELSVELERASTAHSPFAALRSMFVTIDNSDASIAQWNDASGRQQRLPIMEFDRFRAVSGRFGRVEASRHNLSAPDHVFEQFSTTPVATEFR
jgi:hypothetical protein